MATDRDEIEAMARELYEAWRAESRGSDLLSNSWERVYDGTRVMWRAVARRLAARQPEGDLQPTLYIECRQCDRCGHVGINDAHLTHAACHDCGWNGPTPAEDKCQGCGRDGTMTAACPKCSGSYTFLADTEIHAPAAAVPDALELPHEFPGMDVLGETAYRDGWNGCRLAMLASQQSFSAARGVPEGFVLVPQKPAIYQQMHRHLNDAKWEECDKATFDQYMEYHARYGGTPPVRALYAAPKPEAQGAGDDGGDA